MFSLHEEILHANTVHLFNVLQMQLNCGLDVKGKRSPTCQKLIKKMKGLNLFNETVSRATLSLLRGKVWPKWQSTVDCTHIQIIQINLFL